MEIKHLEDFKEQIELNSFFLSSFDEVMDQLCIRVLLNGKKIEYRFYDMIEFVQSFETECGSKILQVLSTEWIDGIAYDESFLISEKDKSDFRHFIFKIGGHKFDILASGFIKDKGFEDTFRDLEIIKRIDH